MLCCMSVNMDELETQTEAESYADHEHINLAININNDAGQNPEIVKDVDPLADELEMNQVAELVDYRRLFRCSGSKFEIGLGYNLSKNDNVSQAAANVTDFDEPEFSAFVGAIYDEPGVIDYFETANKNDNVNPEKERVERNIKDNFEHGPFIDSTDNLSIFVEGNNQTGNTQKASLQVQFVYQIHEVASGIPRFSDPRRMQGDD